jgi:hypothetical protein
MRGSSGVEPESSDIGETSESSETPIPVTKAPPESPAASGSGSSTTVRLLERYSDQELDLLSRLERRKLKPTAEVSAVMAARRDGTSWEELRQQVRESFQGDMRTRAAILGWIDDCAKDKDAPRAVPSGPRFVGGLRRRPKAPASADGP